MVCGEGDADGAAARGYLGVVLESPGEDDAVGWLDIEVLACDGGGVVHDDPVDPAASRVERRALAEPPVVHDGVGEEAEDDLGRCLDVDLVLDSVAGDRHAPRPAVGCRWPGRASASASFFSRTRPVAQKRSMNCLSPASPAGLA